MILSISLLTILISFRPISEIGSVKPDKSVNLKSNRTSEYIANKEQIGSKELDDCSNYIETDVDEESEKNVYYSKEQIVVSDDGKTGFKIEFFLSYDGSLSMTIKVVGAGKCIPRGGKLNILFTDNSKLELFSADRYECDAEWYTFLRLKDKRNLEKQIEELKTKKIKTLKVWTKYQSSLIDSTIMIERDFTPKNSNDFCNTINCLTRK